MSFWSVQIKNHQINALLMLVLNSFMVQPVKSAVAKQ